MNGSLTPWTRRCPKPPRGVWTEEQEELIKRAGCVIPCPVGHVPRE